MIARVFAGAALLTAVAAIAPSGATAQCRDMQGVQAATAYSDRGNRCEGLYVGLQSAPLNLQVVSLVKGALTRELAVRSDTLLVEVPAAGFMAGHDLQPGVAIHGRGRDANLNWALDADSSRAERTLAWPLGDVVTPARLDLDRLGLYGEAVREGGLGGPVFVPVEVRLPGLPSQQADRIEIVFALPAAGSARLCTRAGGCAPVDALPTPDGYHDGYFRGFIDTGAADEGLLALAVRWRAHGGGAENVDRLDVLVW